MCSRYDLTSPPEAVRAVFGYRMQPNFPPREKIAPTEPVPIIRRGLDGEPEFALVRWGLIPGWVKDPRDFTTLFNARSETALEKASFRNAMKRRRCLFPANGFFEWTGPKGKRRPLYFHAPDDRVLAFAGLYEHWMGADGSEVETATILTCAANELVGQFHSRMPAILDAADHAAWLDTNEVSDREALAMLIPAPEDWLVVRAVGKEPVEAQAANHQDSEPRQGSLF